MFHLKHTPKHALMYKKEKQKEEYYFLTLCVES